MRAHVNALRCCGYTFCNEICPDVYEIDHHGQAYVKVDVIPVELEDQARKGADACPQRAITLTDTE